MEGLRTQRRNSFTQDAAEGGACKLSPISRTGLCSFSYLHIYPEGMGLVRCQKFQSILLELAQRSLDPYDSFAVFDLRYVRSERRDRNAEVVLSTSPKVLRFTRQINRWTNGRMDRRNDGRRNGRIDGRTDGGTDERTDRRTDGGTVGWRDGQR